MTHWATEYIGKPWAYGAKGPDAYDCWGFVCAVQRDRYGIEMLDVDYGTNFRSAAKNLQVHDERKNWQEETFVTSKEGDVVMMARSRLPIHVGIWVNANKTYGVLHCLQGAGVTFSPYLSLRGQGWGALQFYRRKVVACS